MIGRSPSWWGCAVVVVVLVDALGPASGSPTPDPSCQQYVHKNNCTLIGDNKVVGVNISLGHPCTFSCIYQPNTDKAVELDVHQMTSWNEANVFVSAQQDDQFNSWKLPILFPEHGNNQPYTSIEAILCPPYHNAKETIYVRVETNTNTNATVNLGLKKQQLKLMKGYNVTVTTTPASPWYKLYQWEEHGDESVLVTVESVKWKSVCALLSLQDATCPIGLTKENIIGGRGRFQSFKERGGMVARKERFPHGVFIVILTLPDDVMCTGISEDFGNKTKRKKSVEIVLLPHATIHDNYGIYLVTLVLIGMIVFGSTTGIIICMNRNLSLGNANLLMEDGEEGLLSVEDDARGVEPPRVVRMGGVRVMQRGRALSNNAGATNDGAGDDLNVEGNEEPASWQAEGVEGRLRAIMADDTNVTSTGDIVNVYEPNMISAIADQQTPQEVVNVTNQSNPWVVYWWKVWSEYKDQSPEANIGAIGFQRNMILVAVFMALPFAEILKSYLNAFSNTGSEDQCFFNTKCITSCGIFSDCSRVLTNFGYLFCGISFIVIVNRHRSLNWRISAAETLGVSRNYGLFTSLAVGLIIQAFMSSMYHVCPNSVTLRLDMMFMYVDAVVLVVGVWGLRHGGVSQHVYPTVGLVGVALLGAELQEFVSPAFFWTVAIIIHVTLTITIGAMLWKFGTWSFSPMDMVSIWRDWKPIIENLNHLVREETSTSATILSCFRASIGVLINIVILVCCACFNVEVYMYILAVCIGNMAMYVTNYVSLKLLHKERGTPLAWVCLTSSGILWIAAIAFFFKENIDVESTPAVSRALNSGCVLFHTFDYHDLWHISSALAMFYCVVGMLTLDDDLARRNPQQISVF